ncbi:isochorismatase family cysteine hydrolase [Piscibacillus halophilus]|uniref:Nicotinamidase-related amidase n=1 Tax=Piscibacillus halophilus TaxID=571933 RepID=A0A1H9DLT6_9BACI|nr:isochorismatase family cysteine hydrolase [Piscibacillus halophilus]SEQ13703.1 Nicotinamidase-related amidase [Piscibacillus halophilus]
MKALLVIDVQNVIVNFKDFRNELINIEKIINDFKSQQLPVIFVRNISGDENNPFYYKSKDSKIYEPLLEYADYTIEKKTPSSFFQTKLENMLRNLNVNQLFITGFNTEFCCMFTAISAFDRGYKVSLIEDATGTVNDANTYEMPGLDIRDFVGTALHWSNTIEVLDFEEYRDKYGKMTNY